jgi:pimeloyl-ACP methyl ester carboxylesterase
VRRFFAELVRRAGARLGLQVLMVVGPGHGADVAGELDPATIAAAVQLTLPRAAAADVAPAAMTRLATELEGQLPEDPAARESQLPRLIEAWQRSDSPERAVRWQLIAMGGYNHAGLYEASLPYAGDIAAALDRLYAEDPKIYCGAVNVLYFTYVPLGRADAARASSSRRSSASTMPSRSRATATCCRCDLYHGQGPARLRPPARRQPAAVRRQSPATDQAHRIGSLFINLGGPGVSGADTFEALGADRFPGLNARFDIIAVDPRGVGQSQPSIDCKVNQETDGVTAQPFTTPENLDVRSLISKDARYIGRCLALNRDVLGYVSTASNARDLDLIRQALGEQQITYFGYSYGTFLGATYASLFPTNYRAMVLDGPVDATAYINDPLHNLDDQTTAFERALGRFLQACADDQAACRGFGGANPREAYDELLAQLDATPVPTASGRAVDGDDVRVVTQLVLYNKRNWPFLAQALVDLQHGDGERMRAAADQGYGRKADGSYEPFVDRYFTITVLEQDYRRDVGTYLRAGKRSWEEHKHFWWNNGYLELNYGLYPTPPNDVFRGPYRVRASSPTPLLVATTYDPATPYGGALNLVRDLANTRLLTMLGDGRTAYPGNSACVDTAVDAYINDGTLPLAGTECAQDVGFPAPAPQPQPLAAAQCTGADAEERSTGGCGAGGMRPRSLLAGGVSRVAP